MNADDGFDNSNYLSGHDCCLQITPVNEMSDAEQYINELKHRLHAVGASEHLLDSLEEKGILETLNESFMVEDLMQLGFGIMVAQRVAAELRAIAIDRRFILSIN